jgi:DNA repair exonuclease SbcCD ATPase subunit
LLDKLNAAKAELEFIYADLNKDRLSLQSLCEIKNKLSSELDECQKTLSQKSIEVQQETKEMYDIEQRIELDARAKKFGGKEAIELNLVSTSKALIALDLLESAANETIEKQRKTGLEPIYKDITDVWNKMRGTQGSKIEVDGTMAPVLFRDGQKHELAQLSGGEKTALLTVIRTVLCRRFLQTGFMLLDEPLEHLDPENRRLIVDFLVESFEKRWVDQLIVTTFEESLLRKFLGNEKVNIIAI